MRYCSKCGHNVNEDASFCSNCGNEIPVFTDVKQKSGMGSEHNSLNETTANADDGDNVSSDGVNSQDDKEKLYTEEDVSKKTEKNDNIPWYKKYWKVITPISIVILLVIMFNNVLSPKESWVFVYQDTRNVTYWVDENSIKKNKDGWIAFLLKGDDIPFNEVVIIELAVDPKKPESRDLYMGHITTYKRDGTKHPKVVVKSRFKGEVIYYGNDLFPFSKFHQPLDSGIRGAFLNASAKAVALYRENHG